MKNFPFAILVLVVGCSEKAAPPPATPPSTSAKSSEFRAPALDHLSYKVPPEWVSEPLGDKMRKAQYRVPDRNGKGEPALLTFFNMAAQETDTIVNYWRQKMGGADASVTKVEGTQNPTTLVDIAGSYSGDGATIENARFLGAMVDVGEQTWYLKFAGPEATVSGWKDAFVEMLKGMRAIQ